eukprot:CAMPEP_0180531866 /NCGR_PEP_ID=MMETSP1036_2-20121128/62743_1 /TAXON_ID=632150 /ORGANISM="Azadinium spinosum, Strain 3D9" /LENGTH=41 /DNA_ID= /DNA_START= /DNA_END= /DNA_ORIENTATION=
MSDPKGSAAARSIADCQLLPSLNVTTSSDRELGLSQVHVYV